MEIFAAEWMERWRSELNGSPEYRAAAATWEGSLALVMTGLPSSGPDGSRAAYLELTGGRCATARPATAGDLASADFLLRADREVWRQLLEGRAEPILWLMTGKLALVRGELARLVPQVRAAKELVAAAGRIGGAFPGDPPPRTEIS